MCKSATRGQGVNDADHDDGGLDNDNGADDGGDDDGGPDDDFGMTMMLAMQLETMVIHPTIPKSFNSFQKCNY